MGEDSKRHFTPENTQVAEKPMKSCSVSLAFREMHTRNSVRPHPALGWLNKTTIRQNAVAHREVSVRELDPSHVAGGVENDSTIPEGILAVSLKTSHAIQFNAEITPLGIYPR